MANLTVSWTAECEHCSTKLDEGHCDDECPDRDDFETSTCYYCSEEVCKDCGIVGQEYHENCHEEAIKEDMEAAETKEEENNEI